VTVKAKPSDVVVAADLGGTNLRVAAVAASGEVSLRVKHSTPSSARKAVEIVKAIVAAARECETRVRKGGASIRAASVVVPGTVDIGGETILQAPNVPCLDGFRLAEALSKELGWPVFLENDANAAALGELWLGAGRDFRTIVCVTLGTGVGGGIILDGELWRGSDGSAGEIGHTTVDPFGGIKCKCGNTGCLEVFASATGIVRMAREAMGSYPKTVLKQNRLNSARIYEAGVGGDQLSLETFRRMGSYLGVGLANLINLLNPEIIVIGGGVANGWKLFEKSMHQEVAERAFPLPAQRVKIVPAKCGDDAGLLGAAYLAFSAGEKGRANG
jgi:glucokinase